MKKNKVTVVKGSGVLQPGRKVKVGSDVHEARKAVIIATGSRVKGLPQIGLEINKTTVISSDEALFLEKAPATLATLRPPPPPTPPPHPPRPPAPPPTPLHPPP